MKITVFYNKTTGVIKSIYVAEIEADFNFFGDKEEEFRLILDKIVIDYDIEFNRNWRDYEVDLDTKTLFKKEKDENAPEIIKILKEDLILKSKENLARYLQTHPLKSYCHNKTEGGYYNCTQEKQNVLSALLLSHTIATNLGQEDVLTWNETEEMCEVYTLEELSQLALEMKEYVKPLVSMQQYIEATIRALNTQRELKSINIEFTDEAVESFRKQFNSTLSSKNKASTDEVVNEIPEESTDI